MITSVYKYRTLQGIVEYKILNGKFGIDSILHLQDTTCEHSGPNCEIEVVKSENGNCYQFSKALNQNAKDYEYFHTLEKYWATKEDAYAELLMLSINRYQDRIEEQKTRMSNAEARLNGMEVKEVNYLMPDSVTTKCYIDDIGVCDIIGTIRFKDGLEGYLTNSNYTAFDCDGDYIEGDRIILVENKNNGRMETEQGETVFLTEIDCDNYKFNNEIKNTIKIIVDSNKAISTYRERIEKCKNIIDNKDSLDIDQMREMSK